ncbi:endonuclease/exonuclease/phosphatase [Streptomyces hygroscopicus]|uniref:endonuclease/exonuclease/phosphatase n=1 Tax=Streptomyces hygroscopicus TaxID=1912 RepID=UPI003687B53D
MTVTTLDVLTFNLNNPSRERAERQLEYLAARPESVLVLTETADSIGCDLLETRFRAAGYDVEFPRPPARGERGAMIVSRLVTRPGPAKLSYLPHRAPTVTVETEEAPVDIIGLYVPSRDTSPEKIQRKTRFLEACRTELPLGLNARVVIGDFNILEPDHTPHYRFFKPFEYQFYRWFAEVGYADAFRTLHPNALAYSWVGRTGDGYRYDHAHVSTSLARTVRNCTYIHEVRTGPDRLTDHSALSLSLALRPAEPLPIAAQGTEAVPALF